MAGLAVAASVAAAAVVVVPQFLGQPSGLGSGATVASAPTTVIGRPADRLMPVSAGSSDVRTAQTPRWQTMDPALGERLNRLVIEHHEFGGRTGINGPVAHIGLVNYAGR
jgi:hypothetical protein